MVKPFNEDWKERLIEKSYPNYNSTNLEELIKPLYENCELKNIIEPSKIKEEYSCNSSYINIIFIPKIDYSQRLGSSLLDNLSNEPTEDLFAGFTLPQLLKHIETQKTLKNLKRLC